MAKHVAMVLALAVLTAGVVYSFLRVASLENRVEVLEQYDVPYATDTTPPDARDSRREIAPRDGSVTEVLRVIDGDTVVIETDGVPLKVRVIGIDTPETMHPAKPIEAFGPEATAHARTLLEGNKVQIQYDPDPTHDRWDRYGRLLTYVGLPDGRDFGLLMIRKGFARAYLKYPFSRIAKYVAAEQAAKNDRVGMWGDSDSGELESQTIQTVEE